MLFAQEPREHEREELGINPYTAPSVAEIFQQLDDLKPLPYEQLKREFPQAAHASREQMGMVFGGLVADGFLIVEAQKSNLVEDLGRVLLRQARSLGVGDRVMRHSASLTELGKKGNWPAVRHELIATQQDVEQAMTDLRDQKMAHLISLGGWLRGLEICAGAVETNYTTDRAAALSKPYELSFTTLAAFDSIWVRLEDDAGKVGLGEAVALPGYGWETVDSVSRTVAAILDGAEGLSAQALEARCARFRAEHPFAASAVMTALELPDLLEGHDPRFSFPINVPVSGETALGR